MKIGFFITARLKSSRLKRKILLDLNGETALDRVIQRAKLVKGITDIVLCTSTNPQDSELYDYALKHRVKFFAGSEEDVLSRLHNTATYFGFDAFVGITADNPLFSIETSSKLVELYKEKKRDFLFTSGLPIGCATYLINIKALSIANKIKRQSDTEIWGPFINRPDTFSTLELRVNNFGINKEQRITLDYDEDLLLFREIYKNFPSSYVPSLQEVVRLVESNKNILNLNEGKIQLQLDESVLRDIDVTFKENRDVIKEYAKSIDKVLVPQKELIEI